MVSGVNPNSGVSPWEGMGGSANITNAPEVKSQPTTGSGWHLPKSSVVSAKPVEWLGEGGANKLVGDIQPQSVQQQPTEGIKPAVKNPVGGGTEQETAPATAKPPNPEVPDNTAEEEIIDIQPPPKNAEQNLQ